MPFISLNTDRRNPNRAIRELLVFNTEHILKVYYQEAFVYDNHKGGEYMKPNRLEITFINGNNLVIWQKHKRIGDYDLSLVYQHLIEGYCNYDSPLKTSLTPEALHKHQRSWSLNIVNKIIKNCTYEWRDK
jgi:hypothetical protein